MNAIPEPFLSNPDAKRIRREIERLSQGQNKALEMAMDLVTSPAEQKQYDERHKEIVNLLKQLTALKAGEFSNVSAKMVELSLQEAKRDPILRGAVLSEVGPVSSPLLWPSPTDVQRIADPSFENGGRTESGVRKAVSAATKVNRQQAHGPSRARTNQWFFTFGRRILGPVRLAAERNLIRQATGSLIELLSRNTARAAQFVADRILTTTVYRCKDCGRELGVRSRPRTFVEHYILPLLLMQPVRCVACFRRDYWLILTTARKRSHTDHETVHHLPRHVA
jgi:hypothetical protein